MLSNHHNTNETRPKPAYIRPRAGYSGQNQAIPAKTRLEPNIRAKTRVYV